VEICVRVGAGSVLEWPSSSSIWRTTPCSRPWLRISKRIASAFDASSSTESAARRPPPISPRSPSSTTITVLDASARTECAVFGGTTAAAPAPARNVSPAIVISSSPDSTFQTSSFACECSCSDAPPSIA